MKLFIGPNCPACQGLKKRLGKQQIKKVEVFVLHDHILPSDSEAVNAKAESDFYDIFGVPALITDKGEKVTDPFEIEELIKGIEG